MDKSFENCSFWWGRWQSVRDFKQWPFVIDCLCDEREIIVKEKVAVSNLLFFKIIIATHHMFCFINWDLRYYITVFLCIVCLSFFKVWNNFSFFLLGMFLMMQNKKGKLEWSETIIFEMESSSCFMPAFTWNPDVQ